MFAVPLSSLFSVFPAHTLVGVTHLHGLHGVYSSLELLPETHPEAYIKGESTFSVGNDLNHDSISATDHCLLQSEAIHSLLHLSFNTDGAFLPISWRFRFLYSPQCTFILLYQQCFPFTATSVFFLLLSILQQI